MSEENSASPRNSYPPEKSLVDQEYSDESDDAAHVAEVTYALPWTTWVVVFACAIWNLTISCTQITALFWSTAINADIGGKAQNVWLGQSFQVVTAIFGPVLARLGDSCGRRYVILFGIFGGAVGCVIMAVSVDFNMCIAGASLFGLSYGSGGNIFSVSSEVLPRAHRGTAQILTLYGAIAGVLIGLYVGAQFITTNPGDYPGWRAACWFNFALHVFSFFLFAVFYFPKSVENASRLTVWQRVMQIDLVGCLLLACGICPLMVGLVWGGAVYAWNDVTIIVTLAVGCAFFIALALHQRFLTSTGLFTHQLFESRNFAVCLVTIFVEGIIYNVFTHFYGVEVALLWDARPIYLATRFSAFVYAGAVAAPLYGVWVFITKDARNVLIFGYGSFLAAIIGMATVKVGTDKISLVYCCLAGIGFAAPLVFLNMVTQLSVRPELMGLATSLIISSRSVGGAVGVAITGAVFTSKATKYIPAYIAAAVQSAGLPTGSIAQVVGGIALQNTTMINSAPGVTVNIIAAGTAAVKVAYADALRYIWITTVPFVVVGIIGLFLLQSTAHQMNAVVDRPVETTRHKEEVSHV